MALPKTERNPFLRRSPGERLKDAGKSVLRFPKTLYSGYRNWPKNLRYVFTGLAALVVVLGLVFGFIRYQKWTTNKEVAAQWLAIEAENRDRRDPEVIRKHIERIRELDPENKTVASWVKALSDGTSDPENTAQWMFIIGDHLKNNRADEIAREAARRVEKVPNDYFAHYLLAKAALEKRDLAKAEPHLIAIANPDGNPTNINYSSLLGACLYLNELRRDSSRVRTFVAEKVNPTLQADWVENADLDVQHQLLMLFVQTVGMPRPPQNSGVIWARAFRVYDVATKTMKDRNDLQTAGRHAHLGASLVAAFERLRAFHLISDAERLDDGRKIDEHIRDSWRIVLAREEKIPEAYLGLAESLDRSGRGREAVETIIKGLDVCGDSPLLLDVFWRIAMHANPMLGYQRLKQAAERNPKNAAYWIRSAQAAATANRRDLAIETIDLGLKQQPDNLELILLKAAVYSGTSHPEKVLHTLANLSDEKLAGFPSACSNVARALGEIGDGERLNAFLEVAREVSNKSGDPRPATAAALGLLDSENLTFDRALQVADYLKPVAEKWKREFPVAAQGHAKSLFRAFELKPGPMDVALGQRALNACEAALLEDPNHVPTAAYKIFLRLRSEKNPIKALEEVGPLIAVTKIDQLTPEQAEVLGMVYVMNGKFDDAVRVLQPYTAVRPTAGCWVQLALAYNGQKRTNDAQDALRRASELSRSDREHADYLAARGQLPK